ncbi:Hsp20/alpha crystallin family protein [Deinococcus enclensis]|uniref:HSP20 family protein n=1 Tax=Deinococcus enclensis TaxID=1049582 RepID=A0ABT9M872_9DEIO|nr:Hsp20/alpha crystallin family protein [Deinococcus enclensis]MDP9762770.1 HSP20 family protein [Deinococcus enclensis]
MNEPVLGRLQQLMTLREGVESLSGTGPWIPAADWLDSDTHLTLLLDVPGVETDSLVLEEEGTLLRVMGERAAPARRLQGERPDGRFIRTLAFPQEVVPQSGEARLAHGVLEVRFEKRHPTIEVTAFGEAEGHGE